jgi:hypothetical protein
LPTVLQVKAAGILISLVFAEAVVASRH